MRIELYHDLACPWCYLGKRRLMTALAARPQLCAQVNLVPFQINPGMPKEGMVRGAYLDLKFGGRDRARQIYRVISEAAARDGVVMRLENIRVTPNSLNAHRLVLFSQAHGGDPHLAAETISNAYFEHGSDIGALDVLVGLAERLGLKGGEARDYLSGGQDVEEVRNSDFTARQMGIQAVPCFVFEGRFVISGAQDPEAFQPLFDLAVAARSSVVHG